MAAKSDKLIRTAQPGDEATETTTIGALLHHPKLFAAYPFLKTFPVAIDDDPQSIGDGRRMIAAYYHGERSALVVGSDPPNSRKHGVFRTCNNLQLAIFIVGSQLHVAIPRAFRRLGQPPPTAFPPQCSHIECSTRTPAPPQTPANTNNYPPTPTQSRALILNAALQFTTWLRSAFSATHITPFLGLTAKAVGAGRDGVDEDVALIV